MRHIAISTLLILGFAGAMSAPASANLLTNGDFSAGGASWTVTSDYYSFDGNAYHEGNMGGPGRLSQTFTDTSGDMLTVSFDYSSDGGDGTAFQDVEFNTVVVPGALVSGMSPLTSHSFALGIATGSDTVTFDGRNDPSYNFLTNVVVTETAVPEPASLALLGVGLAALGLIRRNHA